VNKGYFLLWIEKEERYILPKIELIKNSIEFNNNSSEYPLYLITMRTWFTFHNISNTSTSNLNNMIPSLYSFFLTDLYFINATWIPSSSSTSNNSTNSSTILNNTVSAFSSLTLASSLSSISLLDSIDTPSNNNQLTNSGESLVMLLEMNFNISNYCFFDDASSSLKASLSSILTNQNEFHSLLQRALGNSYNSQNEEMINQLFNALIGQVYSKVMNAVTVPTSSVYCSLISQSSAPTASPVTLPPADLNNAGIANFFSQLGRHPDVTIAFVLVLILFLLATLCYCVLSNRDKAFITDDNSFFTFFRKGTRSLLGKGGSIFGGTDTDYDDEDSDYISADASYPAEGEEAQENTTVNNQPITASLAPDDHHTITTGHSYPTTLIQDSNQTSSSASSGSSASSATSYFSYYPSSVAASAAYHEYYQQQLLQQQQLQQQHPGYQQQHQMHPYHLQYQQQLMNQQLQQQHQQQPYPQQQPENNQFQVRAAMNLNPSYQGGYPSGIGVPPDGTGESDPYDQQFMNQLDIMNNQRRSQLPPLPVVAPTPVTARQAINGRKRQSRDNNGGIGTVQADHQLPYLEPEFFPTRGISPIITPTHNQTRILLIILH
jgi:hypothetical protein